LACCIKEHKDFRDSEGPFEAARQGRDTGHGEEGNIDQVVKELCIYGVKVAGLQETE
jgi:hypothetical protein